MREDVFRLSLPLHDEAVFRVLRFGRPKAPGPVVSIMAGLHGDEYNGPYICWRLARLLDDLEDGLVPGLKIRGQVRMVPAANPLGINLSERFWPFDESDMNRLFPGYEKGETAQRVARALFDALAACDYCVDLHSANPFIKEVPQVRLYEDAARYVDLARAFGLDVVWPRATTSPLVRTFFTYNVAKAGIPTFAIQMGSATRLNRFLADLVFRGLVRFLIEVGVLTGRPPVPPPNGRNIVVAPGGVEEVMAVESGLFVLENELGTYVEAGEILGRLIDPVDPRPAIDVAAPRAGFLFTVRTHPLTYQGSLLARIARDDSTGGDLG